MKVVYARQPFPKEVVSSIFLAGPTPRDSKTKSWRPEALRLLTEAGYGGVVFLPDHEVGGFGGGELDAAAYAEQNQWEEEALNRADCIVFWIPRSMKALPGLTTNDEWGAWKNSGKAVLGCPESAVDVRYQKFHAARLATPTFTTLSETINAALAAVGDGAPRSGGEVQIPLLVWRHPTFTAWLASQYAAGNRLDGARVLWTFRVGAKRERLFSWVVHVDMHVGQEGRNKVNEFVLGRTDVSAVVLWTRPERAPGVDSVLDAEVVLVKEYRSPVRNLSGFVHELPGGSSFSGEEDDEHDLTVASKEVEEETGLKIDPARLRRQGSRQPAATLSAHVASLFSVELTDAEMAKLREDAIAGKPRGVEGDSERTYVDVVTLRHAIEMGVADWTTIGQILTALSRPEGGP